ncbi:DUF1302 domain-containing protein [Pseudomonas putida]|uniref:DUF1302 domain-containing protein n=1 Tax=Pseudomonas putida TaxID=303 RepID=UPI0015769564|nr:DUF1302 domain-containing protein [Pseudomonas putida]NTY91153.1 DUF1302 domain-containing protein [Pseudomonas putida]NTY99146.1 DUF1302 domain-containing protein [Pseudomonas putida]NTZ21399.1 DUF1302 domain-containing protein [Pseudomonas putida]NTZ53593.1 DUF1302 domain-containing protein [Pseudomonas putida]NTZ64768.1 DUF1302 domain-containing protein [Pseudomonas putida]
MKSAHLWVREGRLHKAALGIAVTAISTGLLQNANAIAIDTGNPDVQLRWDNTLRYNLGYRVESQDKSILANPNFDDGDRNFERGLVTNRLDVLSEADLVFNQLYGARLSAAAWYDQAYEHLDNDNVATSNHLKNGQPALGLSRYADRYYNGPSGEILDAFVFGQFELGSAQVNGKLGQHSLAWGEALLTGGAVHGVSYSQNALDLGKAQASPGIEAKELYRPQPQVSTQLQLTPELSVAAQYFFDWERMQMPEAGTYFGAQDIVNEGAQSLVAVPGVPGVRLLRGADIIKEKHGDYGVAMRWRPQWLDGTLGFYYRNFTDKLPQVYQQASSRTFGLAYGDDVDLYGVSLSTVLGGLSVGVDLNYRTNMPLVSNVAALPAGALPDDTPGARGNTVHGLVNVVGTLGDTALFDSAAYAAELTWNTWTAVTDNKALFKGNDSYNAVDKPDKNATALGLNFTPTWFQVFPGADLSLPLSFSQGLHGNSVVTLGGNEGTGSYSVGVGLDYLSQYRFDLKYVDFFGDVDKGTNGAVSVANGTSAILKDRGLITFTFKTTI